ncbi:hypothetical protein ACFSTE_21715 [Aquimarina hainanensis]|uniref:PH domain-containing protein n=1 Tax=Aquimarina hainanensis TaxID=1578017 RepID=A0ABW5NDD7_9FLAO
MRKITKEKINLILKNESGIILLKKESKQSFWEAFFSQWISIITAFYLLTRNKNDFLILTEKRLILIIRNKTYLEQKLNRTASFNYNGIKSTLEITNQKNSSCIKLNKLDVSYEEGKLIRRKLNELKNTKNEITYNHL